MGAAGTFVWRYLLAQVLRSPLLAILFVLLSLPGCRPAIEQPQGIELLLVPAVTAAHNELKGDRLLLVLHNSSENDYRIANVQLIDEHATRPKRVCRALENRILTGGSWEFDGFSTPRQLADGEQSLLQIEFESNGRRYVHKKKVSPSGRGCRIAVAPADPSLIFAYLNRDRPFVGEPRCVVNGRAADCVELTQFELESGGVLCAVAIQADDQVKWGDRLVATIDFGEGHSHAGAAKAFRAFVSGPTQHKLVLRPVEIEYVAHGIRVTVYNESDFRKPPVLIERVMLNGADVTAQCELPQGGIPPDLGNFSSDARTLFIPCESDSRTNRYRIEIVYRRLKPTRPVATPVPSDYFDSQTISFQTQRGVTLPIETAAGLGIADGVCVLHGSLRPVPPPSEIVGRVSAVAAADPAIPIFGCIPRGMTALQIQQLASPCDFAVIGQPVPFTPGNVNRGSEFVDGYGQFDQLATCWAAAIVVEHDAQTEKRDLDWIVWSAVGEGSRGVLLSNADGGEPSVALTLGALIAETLDDVNKLSPQLATSICLPLASDCNQPGVRVRYLLCGTDEVLIVLANEWTSRAANQASEPYLAAARLGVELEVSIPSQWPAVSATDPLGGKPIAVALHDRRAKLTVPQFDAVQLISLKSVPPATETAPPIDKEQSLPPILYRDSPIVSLGTVRPNSKHRVQVSVRSMFDASLTLAATVKSDARSQPGDASASRVDIPPYAEASLAFDFTAPELLGESVTNVRFASSNREAVLPIYVCADVQPAATVSPTSIDFGEVACGDTPAPRELRLDSRFANARIEKLLATNGSVDEVEIAKDGQSCSFSLSPHETGRLSFTVDAIVSLGEGLENEKCPVNVFADVKPVVFSSPSRIGLTMSTEAKLRTITVMHAGKVPIRVVSVAQSDGIRARFKSDLFLVAHTIELEIRPQILAVSERGVEIRIRSSDGKDHFLKVPLTVVPITDVPRKQQQ